MAGEGRNGRESGAKKGQRREGWEMAAKGATRRLLRSRRSRSMSWPLQNPKSPPPGLPASLVAGLRHLALLGDAVNIRLSRDHAREEGRGHCAIHVHTAPAI